MLSKGIHSGGVQHGFHLMQGLDGHCRHARTGQPDLVMRAPRQQHRSQQADLVGFERPAGHIAHHGATDARESILDGVPVDEGQRWM